MPDFLPLIEAIDALPDPTPAVVAWRTIRFVAAADRLPADPQTIARLADGRQESQAQMDDIVKLLAALGYATAVPVFTDGGRPATAWRFQFERDEVVAEPTPLPTRPAAAAASGGDTRTYTDSDPA